MGATYDSIGVGYAHVRRPDPRIARQIAASLGSARRVLNVGAGAGSYEPADRIVVALEPSQRMIEQRPPEASRLVIRGMAGELPFPDGSFDAAMALLTVHHWPDPVAGLREMRRVTTGPVVVFTFDHALHAAQWLVTEYLPSMLELDTECPSPSAIAGRARRWRGHHRACPSRLRRWLLPRMVAAARGLSRSLGARRDLGDRPSARGRRRARHGHVWPTTWSRERGGPRTQTCSTAPRSMPATDSWWRSRSVTRRNVPPPP